MLGIASTWGSTGMSRGVWLCVGMAVSLIVVVAIVAFITAPVLLLP